jgi:hypothetical protein
VRSSTVIVDSDKKLGREEISRKKLFKLSLGAMKSNDHGREDSAAGLLIVIWEGSTKAQAQAECKSLGCLLGQTRKCLSMDGSMSGRAFQGCALAQVEWDTNSYTEEDPICKRLWLVELRKGSTNV